MRKTLFFIASILMIFVTVPALAKSQLSDSNHNKPIIVQSARPVATVTLAANRATGYSWFLSSYDSSLITPLSHKYVSPQKTAAGAPGQSIWTFRIHENAFVVPQILRITMIYGRPWNLTGARKKIITIVTHVKQ